MFPRVSEDEVQKLFPVAKFAIAAGFAVHQQNIERLGGADDGAQHNGPMLTLLARETVDGGAVAMLSLPLDDVLIDQLICRLRESARPLRGSEFRSKVDGEVVKAFQMTLARREDNSEWPDWLNHAWNLPRGSVGSVYPTVAGDRFGTLSMTVSSVLREGTVGEWRILWDYWIIRTADGWLCCSSPILFTRLFEEA